MKKDAQGKLIPETREEAKDLVRLFRQTAVQKLDWSERATNERASKHFTNAAKDLLNRAEDLVDEWNIGTIEPD